ncbi:spore germination protein GerW family protein [Haladaptatus sp. DYF46]|uniref:spore germination protein GerW family protein n=1 Tax=Haladaptatus sp. DYF46 TaxID=2886041 RepID=UPI001E55EAD3|nr:spore germination protein GerW family protein [Haladaptatus sp. DYF46]
MDAFERLEALLRQLRRNVGVETVYGTPIQIGNRTIIPVAKVGYGFGGVGGTNGSRMGGGAGAGPVGALEVSPEGTRFVRFSDSRRTLVALGVGIAIGLLVGYRN